MTIVDRYLTAPFKKGEIKDYKVGDMVYITGTIYSARDAAHKRMDEALEKGEKLPFDIGGSIIYYLGPSPARPGRVIGSAGPTTSGRMDKYTPRLLDLGLGGMIGKGKRTEEVRDSIVKNGSIYFAAVGGAGALLSECIKESTVIAYEDLGTEAVRKLRVENFPCIVAIDTEGNNIYDKPKK
ncbi:MAG: Fe-S-containing hydro-lyase [Lachnospiraceae bacterium]|nr:Fe-S-containing hydro-lyase [Lachnospiraceae bacterium]